MSVLICSSMSDLAIRINREAFMANGPNRFGLFLCPHIAIGS